jgi:hypothetical protein
VDPLGGANAVDLGAPTINPKKHLRWAPLGGASGGSDPHQVSERCVVTYIDMIEKGNSTHGSHSPCT